MRSSTTSRLPWLKPSSISLRTTFSGSTASSASFRCGNTILDTVIPYRIIRGCQTAACLSLGAASRAGSPRRHRRQASWPPRPALCRARIRAGDRSRPSPRPRTSRPRRSTPPSATSARSSRELVGSACAAATTPPVLEQAGPRAVAAARDQREQLRLFAADIALRLERVGPLLEVLTTAARSDPELAELRRRASAGGRLRTSGVRRRTPGQWPAPAGARRSARRRVGAREPGVASIADRHTGLDAGAVLQLARRQPRRAPARALAPAGEARHLEPGGPEAAPLVEPDRRARSARWRRSPGRARRPRRGGRRPRRGAPIRVPSRGRSRRPRAA